MHGPTNTNFNTRTFGPSYILYSLADTHLKLLSILFILRNTKKLLFMDANIPGRIHYRHTLKGQEPGILCASSASTIWCLDLSQTPHVVRHMDCRKTPPQHLPSVTHLQYDGVIDICHFNNNDNHDNRDFIVVGGSEGVSVINMESGECEWSQTGSLPGLERPMEPHGVTADPVNNRILVCDSNHACAQMFSAADGDYLGEFLREGDHVLGKPLWISWNKASSSSVIVAHSNNETWTISDITLQCN